MFELLFFETKMCIINSKKHGKIINTPVDTSVRLLDSAKDVTWQAQRTTLHKSKMQNGTGKYAKGKKGREEKKAKKTK